MSTAFGIIVKLVWLLHRVDFILINWLVTSRLLSRDAVQYATHRITSLNSEELRGLLFNNDDVDPTYVPENLEDDSAGQ